MSAALVPVKALSGSKSRLLPDLSREELDALAIAMLEDVVTALLETPEIDRVAVATPDDRVAAATRRLGAEALHGPDPGLNEAIEMGAAKLHLTGDAVRGEASLLVVLGDVAGARASEISQLYAALDALPDRRGAILAPSSDGGTAALLRRPPDAVPARFGKQSAARHEAAAREAGVSLERVALPSLALDLDDARDVERFLASDSGGPRTRSLLDQLGWSAGGGEADPFGSGL